MTELSSTTLAGVSTTIRVTGAFELGPMLIVAVNQLRDAMTDLSHYRRMIAAMTKDELLGESKKLDNLLNNLNQEHSDREDTLNIVLKEKEEVRKELSLRYLDSIEGSSSENPF